MSHFGRVDLVLDELDGKFFGHGSTLVQDLLEPVAHLRLELNVSQHQLCGVDHLASPGLGQPFGQGGLPRPGLAQDDKAGGLGVQEPQFGLWMLET